MKTNNHIFFRVGLVTSVILRFFNRSLIVEAIDFSLPMKISKLNSSWNTITNNSPSNYVQTSTKVIVNDPRTDYPKLKSKQSINSEDKCVLATDSNCLCKLDDETIECYFKNVSQCSF